MHDTFKITEAAIGEVCARIEAVQERPFHFGVRPSVLSKVVKMGFSGDRWFLQIPNRELSCICDGNCVVDAVTTAAALSEISGAGVNVWEYGMWGSMGNSVFNPTHFRARINWGGVIKEEVDHSRFYGHFFRPGLIWGREVDQGELFSFVKPDNGEPVRVSLWGLPYTEFPIRDSWGLALAGVVSGKKQMELRMSLVMPDQPEGEADFTAILPVPFGAVNYGRLHQSLDSGDFWLVTGLQGGRNERERVVLHEMGRQLFSYSLVPGLKQWMSEMVDILPAQVWPVLAGEE